ncbi:hypothetical protein ACLF6K_09375 [Streptomyces xanthophaeus]|uniref:hypothetical protein n=1 Tax=Streptomyces xanthophaeus TaxID=67385 RepID=UPI00398FEC2C
MIRDGHARAQPEIGGAFAAEAYEVLARAGAWTDRAREEAQRHAAAERHAASVRQILERIEQSAQKSRMALRLAGTSRRETLAVSAQYQQQYAAALAEAERASGASAQALREGWGVLTGYQHISLLAQGWAATPPGDVQAMEAVLVSLQQRVPVLADRLDARVADDVQQLRSRAAAQRAVAARHGAKVEEIQREAALREEIRSTAPIRHARGRRAHSRATDGPLVPFQDSAGFFAGPAAPRACATGGRDGPRRLVAETVTVGFRL